MKMGPTRPLIGIEVDLETNQAGRRYAKCYETYFDRIVDAGGAPILLPPASGAVLAQVLARVDGVVVPGGDDFAADEWGETQRPCPRFTPSDERRLDHGRQLMRVVLERKTPFLGVCYGAQLLNLVLGGSLVQDIPDELPAALDHSGPAHAIDVAAGSLVAQLSGGGALQVNSRHHQAISRPGEGLRVSATAPDGVVEAIEGQGEQFLLGVQWHPEELVGQPTGSALFQGLVEAARVFNRVSA